MLDMARPVEGRPDAVRDPQIAREALAGLSGRQKTLPAKLFYDDEGCRLFGLITRLPEYYPTRTERALLAHVAGEVVAEAGQRAVLVEYGASDEGKALVLLDAATAGENGGFGAYVPIDVAAGALAALRTRMTVLRPDLAVHPLVADFLEPIALPELVRGMPSFGFFPGSTIGNLEPEAAAGFLRQVRRTLGLGGRLVIGVDMCRDPERLVPAYDDAQGVTAAFNRNILAHLNRVAGAGFDLDTFEHRAIWNAGRQRIEMHLVSTVAQSVSVAGQQVCFDRGESIHTENSHKYGLGALEALAGSAGWSPVGHWTDPDHLFALHLFTASHILGGGRPA